MSINLNTPADTDLLADTDLYLKDAATQVDAALAAGYQFGYYTGTTQVYDAAGTVGVTIPGLSVVKGAKGTIVASDATNGPCLFGITSYGAGGAGTVYGTLWLWPCVWLVRQPPVPPATIGVDKPTLIPGRVAPQGTSVTLSILAWGTP